MNSRVLKYTKLTNNLTKMMTSVCDLLRDYDPFLSGFRVGALASRLTWIMLYFYGAMTHYASWIFDQTQVNSVAQMHDPSWITFMQSLEDFFTVLATLPEIWLDDGTDILINDTGAQQIIPTEAPLELVAEICLRAHGAVGLGGHPGKTVPSWSLRKPKAGSRPQLT